MSEANQIAPPAAKIRVLLSTGSLHAMDTAHCFALAAETGFDGIEILCGDRWSTRDPVDLTALSRRYGLPVSVAHTSFSRRLHGWNHADEVQRIQSTLILPWRSPYGRVKRWIEHKLPEAQRKTPVKIAIENMPR